MSGEKDLQRLLKTMSPQLQDGHFVFCSVAEDFSLSAGLKPLASFYEQEGLTLILEQQQARSLGIAFEGVFRQLTLTVHSSLEAVGLTAAVATTLALSRGSALMWLQPTITTMCLCRRRAPSRRCKY